MISFHGTGVNLVKFKFQYQYLRFIKNLKRLKSISIFVLRLHHIVKQRSIFIQLVKKNSYLKYGCKEDLSDINY
jgi:hypothetical protein